MEGCAQCQKPSKSICSRCHTVRYCSAECQRKHWPLHKDVCVLSHTIGTKWRVEALWTVDEQGKGGYPTEPLLHLFKEQLPSPLSAKEEKKWSKLMPMLFEAQRHRLKTLQGGGQLFVSALTVFQNHFSTLSQGVFAKVSFENVLVAGGAVCLCVLPLDPRWKRLRPPIQNNELWECNFLDANMGTLAREPGLEFTLDHYLLSVRWPTSDIDVFIYGLDEARATEKALSLLHHFRETIRSQDPRAEVYFVRTQHTITLCGPDPRRKIQIILRLYDSKESILNGFDIDCCCVGYDGTSVLCTKRFLRSVLTKTNVINLDIRGENYEPRLVKYAERGFAVGVPALRSLNLNRAALSPQIIKDPWRKGDDFYTLKDWADFTDCQYLRRLIVTDEVQKSLGGVIEMPFAGRNRNRDMEWPLKITVQPGPEFKTVSDTYGGGRSKRGQAPVYHATPHFEHLRGSTKWSLKWEPGNMPRKSVAWEEWSRSAVGQQQTSKYDYEKARREREEKKRADEAKAAAERQAELQRAREQGEKEAREQLLKDEARSKEEEEKLKRKVATMEKRLKEEQERTRKVQEAQQAARESLRAPVEVLPVGEERITNDLILCSQLMLGTGATSQVFVGRSESRGLVAVKVIPAIMSKAVEDELKALRRLDEHPNVVSFYFSAKKDQRIFLVTALCVMDLKQLFEDYLDQGAVSDSNTKKKKKKKKNKNKNFPSNEGLEAESLNLLSADREQCLESCRGQEIRIVRELCEGIRFLHHVMHWIHRDVKPANILLDRRGTVKISDLGMSKDIDEGTITATAISVGTKGWRAPEVVDRVGQRTPAADVFSIGLLAHYIFSGGVHPFGTDGPSRELRIVNGDRPLQLQNIEQAHFVSCCLVHKKEKRWDVQALLSHPLLMSSEEQVSFLIKAWELHEKTLHGVAMDGFLAPGSLSIIRVRLCPRLGGSFALFQELHGACGQIARRS